MEELDFDNMTDEQVDEILNGIQTGKYSDVGGSNGTEEDEDESNDANDEDTDGSKSDDADTDTNDQIDGDDQDTEDADEDEDQANALVGKDNEGNDDEGAEADTQDADLGTETQAIDAAEYERYKKFYDKLTTAEFVANGKKVKAFTDPDKILQSQQMSYGFGPKMAAIKEYRPFLTTLKEKGFLENPDKFNFAMDLLDGDPEALKKHMQTLNVDPIDLDMDSVSYSGKNHLTSKEALVLEDTIEIAKNYGVEEKLRATIGKEWDTESFNEFLTVPEVRKDLLDHMATGAFDLVQDRIAEMKTLDISGSFTSMKATDQYRQAVQSLTADAARMNQQEVSYNKEATTKPAATRPTVNKDAELAAKQEAEYKRNLEAKNLKAEEARKKAVSVSKKKASTATQAKFDPLALTGKEFDDYVDSLIRA